MVLFGKYAKDNEKVGIWLIKGYTLTHKKWTSRYYYNFIASRDVVERYY